MLEVCWKIVKKLLLVGTSASLLVTSALLLVVVTRTLLGTLLPTSARLWKRSGRWPVALPSGDGPSLGLHSKALGAQSLYRQAERTLLDLHLRLVDFRLYRLRGFDHSREFPFRGRKFLELTWKR